MVRLWTDLREHSFAGQPAQKSTHFVEQRRKQVKIESKDLKLSEKSSRHAASYGFDREGHT